MSIFRFKQFAIQQDRCAMKVNTDGVLLGAWATIYKDATHILDIGTGTGVLALMAAQRQPSATIHAVEIEPNAAQQATDNVMQSPFAARVSIFAESIQQYATQSQRHGLYQHIWSNPPYYPESQHLAANGSQRQLARSTVALPFEELLAVTYQLLHPSGICSLVVPTELETYLHQVAPIFGLHTQYITYVVPRQDKPANRVLLQLGKQQQPVVKQTLTIRNAGVDYHDYTAAYIHLLKDFYTIF